MPKGDDRVGTLRFPPVKKGYEYRKVSSSKLERWLKQGWEVDYKPADYSVVRVRRKKAVSKAAKKGASKRITVKKTALSGARKRR